MSECRRLHDGAFSRHISANDAAPLGGEEFTDVFPHSVKFIDI